MPPRRNLKIVSFDDGGVRGFSQLEIMRNIMHRLNWDSQSNISAEQMLPCEHFDLIGGSGTGGLIAILFTKLRMSIEEASEEFERVIEQVYQQDGLLPSDKTERLRGCVEDALRRKQLPINLPLIGSSQPDGCAGFVVASLRTNTKSILCLRTYPVRSQAPSSITVIEAILATCATQPEFVPVSSGSGFRKREYIAAAGSTNPINEAITEAHALFGGDMNVASLLSLGTGHPGIITLPSAAGEVALNKIIRDMMHDCEQRAQEIEQRIGRVGIYSRFSVEQGMQNGHPGQVDDLGWIVSQTEDYLTRHDTCQKLDLFEQNALASTTLVTLDQLKHVGNHTIPNQLATSLEASLGILISNKDDAVIARLKPADLECGSHATECMEGTRQDILARVDAWLSDLEAPNILWIKGYPGVGKSAIATSLVEKWRSSGRLGSSFFFRRERANAMTPQALWRTVAHDLGRRYTTIRKHLVITLNANETLPTAVDADALFNQLLREPLIASEDIPTESLPIIVVDALDECGGLDGRYSDHRKSLMRTLKMWSNLPRRFKLVVTSRVEHDIERLFSTVTHHPVEILAGQKVDSISAEDIRAFLAHELRQIATQYQSLPADWPGGQTISQLAGRAAGLFIWAKTVIKLLERGEPRRTLKQILEGGGAGNMAGLYTWILNASFPNPSEEDVMDFRSILGTIIFAKVPLDAESLSNFLSIESSAIGYVCNGLQSVLDSRDALQINHQSFVDFLLDPKECPPRFLIESKRETRNLTGVCFQVMNRHLRFNICGLKSSYLRNDQIAGLDSLVNECIPTFVFYSSRFWADHLAEIKFDAEIFDKLQYFMRNQFLFWLEVLSLTSLVHVASRILWSLLKWIRDFHKDDSIARDMQQFVANFANVISQSAPHIYLSALPFSPQHLAISQLYAPHYPQTLAIRYGGQSSWPAIQNVLSGHTGAVKSVTLSADGRRIISGSSDRTIRIWDAETGQAVMRPLSGHSGPVNSVALSPDGKRIVSGSGDHTIRVWDMETGETVLGPLTEHDSAVYAASFTPNGTRIVSIVNYGGIRLWDAGTGEPLLKDDIRRISFKSKVEQGLTWADYYTSRSKDIINGEVVVEPLRVSSERSTSFSPDGKHMVANSWDGDILIWNVETGKPVMGPLKGHSGTVCSTSFSMDGRRIVSGSKDDTIRVWDVDTGETVVGPLKGHVYSINSVSFSPDGRRIISGSNDTTIRVWDVEIGETAVDPSRGNKKHVNSALSPTDSKSIVLCSKDRIGASNASMESHSVNEPIGWITSVLFSPGGGRIISGSNNRTILVCDAETGEAVVGPLKGHTMSITSVSVSMDGRRIVSGSADQTIRVWDAETGETVVGPLKGHRGRVRTVSFSPDGRRVVSSSDDKTIRIWNADTGEVILGPLEKHSGFVYCASFSRDGRHIVSGSSDRTIQVWDAEKGTAGTEPLRGHSGPINSVSFSRDDRHVVSASWDCTIRIWDVETGKTVVGPMKGHTERVISASFSPDGGHIVSGSEDRTIRVWDAEKGQTVIGPLEGHSKSITSAIFSPDGRYIVSGSGDETIRVWNVQANDSTIFALFNDSPKTKDGWILGPNSELVFWVPPEIRLRLRPLRNTLLIGGDSTLLNMEHFVHGDAWYHCKDHSA